MKQIIDIVRSREYLGFVLGSLFTVAAYELLQVNRLDLLALLMCPILFIGWLLIKKYGS